MASYNFILFALFLLQGTWGSPAKASVSVSANTIGGGELSLNKEGTGKIKTDTPTVTLGSELSNNMKDNLMKAMDNMRNGVIQISTPIVKFAGETMPNLYSSSLKTMADSASKIVDAKKKGFKTIVNGAANAVGGGAVLGSAMVGGNMQLIGSGLGVAGDLIDAAARLGLDLTGNLADTAALGNKLFATITKDILTGVGDGLNVVGDGVSVVSKGSSKVINAVGNSISHSIKNAQDNIAKWFKNGSAKLQDGTITLTTAAQVNYYNALQWYLQNLLAMEGVMNKLSESIDSSGEITSSGSKIDVSIGSTGSTTSDDKKTKGDKNNAKSRV